MTPMSDAGWGWVTTDYTDLPQIQRSDDTRPNWNDDQAAAYVLAEMARVNPEHFAQALQLHTLSNVWHAFGGTEPSCSEPRLPYQAEIVRRYDYIKLPEDPPDWLKSLT